LTNIEKLVKVYHGSRRLSSAGLERPAYGQAPLCGSVLIFILTTSVGAERWLNVAEDVWTLRKQGANRVRHILRCGFDKRTCERKNKGATVYSASSDAGSTRGFVFLTSKKRGSARSFSSETVCQTALAYERGQN
jgi:hypothetical protein